MVKWNQQLQLQQQLSWELGRSRAEDCQLGQHSAQLELEAKVANRERGTEGNRVQLGVSWFLEGEMLLSGRLNILGAEDYPIYSVQIDGKHQYVC